MKQILNYLLTASFLLGSSGFSSVMAHHTVGTHPVANLAHKVQALHDRVTALENADARISALEASVATLLADLTTANSIIATLQTDLGNHTSQISAINNSNVMDLDAYLTVSTKGVANATLSGINLQIVNGLGTTDTINGLGNLIVGYDEVNTWLDYRCSLGDYIDQTTCELNGHTWSNSHKTGSHYLVLGSRNSYSQYGGMVAGGSNYANGVYSTVTGGFVNTASGSFSSVSGGGNYNTASGYASSVSGGTTNTASEKYSSVSGGSYNTASGWYSSVSGGFNRSSTEIYDWRAGSLFEDL